MTARRGKTKLEEGYGRGEASIAAGDDVLIEQSALEKRLLETFGAPDYQPPTLPAVATQLMSVSQRADVEIDEIVDLLQQDAMLAGKLMELVASPLYAGAAKITSLRDAVMRVGMQNVRDLVMQVALNLRVFRVPAYSETMERLRRHSVLTAHLSRIVSRYTPIESEYAFLCGLLHDVGVAGVLIALAEGTVRVPAKTKARVTKAGKPDPPDLAAVWPEVDAVHGVAASQMSRLWGLPPELAIAIGSHHQVLVEGYAHPLAATICVADAEAQALGFGIVSSTSAESETEDVGIDADDAAIRAACMQSHHTADHSTPATLGHACDALGLDDPQLELIRKDAREFVENWEEGGAADA
ncbi:MAG: HDOD domain-containing protein [Myxococcota bacterium]